MEEQEQPPKSYEETTGKTEDSAVFNDPIEIKIGGVAYRLQKPSMRDLRQWRAKLITMQKALQAESKAHSNGNGAAPDDLDLFSYLNDTYLPALVELIADYGKSSGLTLETIDATGTENELITAFVAIIEHSKPPLAQMKALM